jgi:hypothetical protein
LERGLDTDKGGKETAYLENNLERMTDGTFRQAGYLIGSGVSKLVVRPWSENVKGSEMFWSEVGGQGCWICAARFSVIAQTPSSLIARSVMPHEMTPSKWLLKSVHPNFSSRF